MVPRTLNGLYLCVAMLLTALFGAARAETTGAAAAEYQWHLPEWLSPPPVPAGNPMSVVKVELGRRLFYDIRLSGPGYMACASCHKQRLGFADKRTVAIGSTGMRHSLNTPHLANVGYQSALTSSDPLMHSLEVQALKPLFGTKPIEMGVEGHEAHILRHLGGNPIYTRLFQQSFPKQDGRIGFDTITKALAAFQRTLISANAPYDRYRSGNDPTALSAAARRGAALFFGPRMKCGACHNGRHLTDAIPQPAYHNTGLYNEDAHGGLPDGVRGLIEATGRPEDMGKFKTPSLRNVAVTAPYMHDGSLKTLGDVLDHYAAGGNAARRGRRSPRTSPLIAGFTISPAEKQDLIAFLNALTDQQFLHDPRFGTPFR